MVTWFQNKITFSSQKIDWVWVLSIHRIRPLGLFIKIFFEHYVIILFDITFFLLSKSERCLQKAF